ncbi:Lrp/AsnC family transcriptional regulator [Ruminococcaceae bacterium OttesenSCG-928-I18]|nr:Lrp/AsnC family transcriptional regulator [Ruminococcaceae bacterium OttesenSCG-928-I18]
MDKLLRVIENNARLSLEEIAAMIGESPEAVAARLDDYKRQGVIRGNRTLIDWERVGGNGVHAMIEVRVSPETDYGFDEIAEKISRLEEVDSVMLMSGGYDLGVDVRGESFEEVAMFVSRRLAPLSGVLSTVTHFVLRVYKKAGALYSFEDRDERERVNV